VKTINRIIEIFDSIPTFWLIFLLLCANHILPVTTENEDMYFGLALQYINPDWIPNSFVFTESPGTRLLFQWIIGPFLTIASAEIISVVGQITCYGLYAISLSRIFKLFQINNVLIFFLLQLVFIKLQAFTGGEWIFRNFETKSIAYIFIFLSVECILKKNWKNAVIWTVPAFYFHVLVGGWYFMALMIFFLFKRLPLKICIKYGCTFLLLVSPFLIYLFKDILNGQASVINGVNLDWVYTYFRNPHHTVTWHMGWPWFRKFRVEGLGMLVLTIFIGILAFRKSDKELIRNIWLFCFATYLILFLAYGLSYFDMNGKVLKFYVFRIGSVSFLITLILILFHFKNWANKKKFRSITYLFLLLLSLVALPIKIDKIIKEQVEFYNNRDYLEVIDYLKEVGNPGEIIAYFNGAFRTFMPRKTRLEPVVDKKFVPSGTEKLYEWYLRILETEAVEKDYQLLEEYLIKYNVKFILTTQQIPEKVASFQSGELIVYQLQ